MSNIARWSEVFVNYVKFVGQSRLLVELSSVVVPACDAERATLMRQVYIYI